MRCVPGVILCTLLGVATAGAEPFQLGPIPVEGVLILRNGQAVAGSLTRAGDHFFVALPEGEIRLRADDVEMACRDLDEAYSRRRAVMPAGDAHRHLELAGWCLRHRLIGPAASELADAIRANPDHPLIPLLRRRLELAMQPDGNDGEENLAGKPAGVPGTSREDLDALVRRLPSGTVETFTAEVQPLLMNNCTSSGCHGPNSDHEFRLLRVARNRPGGRRITQQNLHAVLQWIDRDAPENSRLLTVPIELHGGMDRPVFTQRELGQLRQLTEWAARLGHPAERDDIPASVGAFHGIEAGAESKALSPAQQPAPGFGSETVAPPVDASPRVQRGAPPNAQPPADPFDPNIFNRQYLGEAE